MLRAKAPSARVPRRAPFVPSYLRTFVPSYLRTSVPLRPVSPPLVEMPVPVAQLGLAAHERPLHAADEDVLPPRQQLEGVAVPHHHVRHLPRLQRAVAVGHAPDLRRVE